VNIKNYQLHEIKTAYVGASMIKVGQNLKEEMRFIPLVNIDERLKGEEFYLPMATPYEAIFDEQNHAYFVILDRHEIFSVKVDASGKVLSGQKYFDVDEKIFDQAPKYFGIMNSKIYELNYSGRIDNYIMITYKEFYVEMDDVKREIDQIKPGFAEQITYDLDAGDEIVYKNFRLKIHKATNEQIEFEILSDTI